ncbi:MAG: hypothetical protein JXA82_09905 [Sedimentisphaerales bacterium]|nr:hypothetical protein [Sedimentisphaerales bacterium]
MNTLDIELEQGKVEYRPGETITGITKWQCMERPDKIELRLIWYTRGKGDEDIGLVDTITFDGPALYDTHKFQFTLPTGPYSFSGKLISLLWAIELVIEPSEDCKRIEITVSPTGKEIVLKT